MSRHQEEAVSPVVGVMLMLVITIIIAAVVSAFAGGLWGNTEKAPVVTIQASLNLSKDGGYLNFTHYGGDPFQLRDIKIIVNDQSSTESMMLTNITSNVKLIKIPYKDEEEGSNPGLIRAGDRFGTNTTDKFFYSDNEYRWSIIHNPSQKTIATGTVFS